MTNVQGCGPLTSTKSVNVRCSRRTTVGATYAVNAVAGTVSNRADRIDTGAQLLADGAALAASASVTILHSPLHATDALIDRASTPTHSPSSHRFGFDELIRINHGFSRASKTGALKVILSRNGRR